MQLPRAASLFYAREGNVIANEKILRSAASVTLFDRDAENPRELNAPRLASTGV